MDDLIRKQDAIDTIIKKPAWHGSEGSFYHADDIRDAINNLPSAQQWIPCDKRLPDDGTYLCCEREGFCYVDSFKDGNWLLNDITNAKCIAWMPLPEPYKGGE